MQTFYRLRVAAEARALTVLVYRATQKFPTDERFGLTSQLRRAAVSIGLNIAEGCGRGTVADFRRFLHMANGSTLEVEFGLLIAQDLSFGDSDELERVSIATRRMAKMLATMITKLKTPPITN